MYSGTNFWQVVLLAAPGSSGGIDVFGCWLIRVLAGLVPKPAHFIPVLDSLA
jgi:hypothetical protein